MTEKILEKILEELKYQTKLLEDVINVRRANNAEDQMQHAMDMVMKMPIFKTMAGADKIKNMMKHGNKK